MSIDELCQYRITLDYSKKNENLHIDSNLKRNKTHRQGIHKLDSSLFEIRFDFEQRSVSNRTKNNTISQ